MINQKVQQYNAAVYGRAEIEFNFRDELEEVLLWAAMRKKEVNKYAG